MPCANGCLLKTRLVAVRVSLDVGPGGTLSLLSCLHAARACCTCAAVPTSRGSPSPHSAQEEWDGEEIFPLHPPIMDNCEEALDPSCIDLDTINAVLVHSAPAPALAVRRPWLTARCGFAGGSGRRGIRTPSGRCADQQARGAGGFPLGGAAGGGGPDRPCRWDLSTQGKGDAAVALHSATCNIENFPSSLGILL